MALCGIIKHHNKNEKPCVLGFWHFLTSERIAGLSASLSAKKRRNKLIINELRRFFIEWLIKICATFQLEVQQTSLSR